MKQERRVNVVVDFETEAVVQCKLSILFKLRVLQSLSNGLFYQNRTRRQGIESLLVTLSVLKVACRWLRQVGYWYGSTDAETRGRQPKKAKK